MPYTAHRSNVNGNRARTIVFDLDFAVRMETAGDVTSGVAVEEVDVDFTVKSGDCR